MYKNIFNLHKPKIQKFNTEYLVGFPICMLKSLKKHNKTMLA
jgi:hypothetical protein